MALVPRPEIYTTYWYVAAERQRIFYKRLAGEAPPYSADPIFQTQKFCNAYRILDRVTQFLIQHVQDGQLPVRDAIFRTIFFRLLNKPETWTALEAELGEPVTLQSFDQARYATALERIRQHGPIYGNAFILCANKAFGHDAKHKNHLALLAHVFQDTEIGNQLSEAQSLEALYLMLRDLPLMGPFMAYQIAIDLNYLEHFPFSENDFTVAGPGAVRGIAKVFADRSGYSDADIIRHMVEGQAAAFAECGLDFKPLPEHPLTCIDCQGLLCETDKYCRLAFPELVSNRTKMKAKFHEHPTPLSYRLPRKWGGRAILPA